MRVLLTSAAPPGGDPDLVHGALRVLERCVAADRFGVHTRTEQPERADLILFAESEHGVGLLCLPVRNHEFVRRFPEKCFLYNASDTPIPYLPGLYASLPPWQYASWHTRAAHYLSSHYRLPPVVESSERDWLFSFVGSAVNAPVRQRIVELRHPRGYCKDVSRDWPASWGQGVAAVERVMGSYAEVMARSQFILCPRGRGLGSVRLFEAMRAGRAPVILADGWTPPTGPDWGSFAVTLPERAVAELPRRLESLEARAAEMGQLARRAWEEWFAEDVSWHRVVEWCLEIKRSRIPGAIHLGRALAQAGQLHPTTAIRLARHAKHQLRKKYPFMTA